MRILHTSDWHLGHSLFGRKRYEEFASFLAWLEKTIEQEQVDVLLVAGDVFDTTTPGNRATSLYYAFLHGVSKGPCRHVVITAGNHDSPTFLDAPRDLLRTLDVHVVGGAKASPEDEVILLRGKDGLPELAVCAVPYLRDRDLRQAEAGESAEDKDRKLLEGIRRHYGEAGEAGLRFRREHGIPLVVMGHLFAAGGRAVEGDGMRELYVGSLVHIPASVFPAQADYVALGHLHAPQVVGGSERMRYSGSPLPMSFGEAERQKSVVLADLVPADLVPADTGEGPYFTVSVNVLPVPVFQKIVQVRGSLEEIEKRFAELAAGEESVWLEVLLQGEDIVPNLRRMLEDMVDGARLELLRIRDMRLKQGALSALEEGESLDALTPEEVFERCLAEHEVPEEQRADLKSAFAEVVTALAERDARAE